MLARCSRLIRRFARATHLGWVGFTWLAVALAAVAGALLVLSAAVEDVVRRNGMEVHDAARLRWFTTHRSGWDVDLARVVTLVGSPPVLAAIALGAGVWLWRRGSHLVVAAAPALALGVAGLAASVTKVVVDRQRPPVSLHLVTETEPSFPSGHTTDSMAVFMTIALVVAITILRTPRARAAIVLAAGALTGAIGTSRLFLGVHWPSDVIAGWALGLSVAIAIATAATLIARTRPDPTARSQRPADRLLLRLQALALAERHRARVGAA